MVNWDDDDADHEDESDARRCLVMMMIMKTKVMLKDAWGKSFSELWSNHVVAAGPRAEDAELPAPK